MQLRPRKSRAAGEKTVRITEVTLFFGAVTTLRALAYSCVRAHALHLVSNHLSSASICSPLGYRRLLVYSMKAPMQVYAMPAKIIDALEVFSGWLGTRTWRKSVFSKNPMSIIKRPRAIGSHVEAPAIIQRAARTATS